MDIHHHHHHAVEFDVEFWPVEHPMEPQDEDRPVRCPIPTSSVVNVRILFCLNLYNLVKFHHCISAAFMHLHS